MAFFLAALIAVLSHVGGPTQGAAGQGSSGAHAAPAQHHVGQNGVSGAGSSG